MEAEEATASGGDLVAWVTTGCQSQQDLWPPVLRQASGRGGCSEMGWGRKAVGSSSHSFDLNK